MDVHQEIKRLCDMASALTKDDKTDDSGTMSPIKLTNATGTYLHHLNEDCLLDIFSSNSLTLMDLCSLAETCTGFKRITQRVFPKDYEIDSTHRIYAFKSKNRWKGFKNLQDVERILKNFGPRLSSLKINKDLAVVNLVAKYCGDITLRHLEISRLTSIKDVRLRLNSIFQRLSQLSICYCINLIGSSDMNLDSLIELKIVRSTLWDPVLKNTFPNLERFVFLLNNSMTTQNGDIMVEFIRRHGHLRTICLESISVSSSELLHVITSNCNELEELTFEHDDRISFDFYQLQSLRKLKVLHVSFRYGDMSIRHYDLPDYQEFSQAFKSLETVKISHIDNAVPLKFFDVLSQLQNLRELHLQHCPLDCIPWTMLVQLKKVVLRSSTTQFYDEHFLNIIRRLINLEELQYAKDFYDPDVFTFYLSSETFFEIAKMVERRDHVLTLKCWCEQDFVESYDGNQKVKLIKLDNGRRWR